MDPCVLSCVVQGSVLSWVLANHQIRSGNHGDPRIHSQVGQKLGYPQLVPEVRAVLWGTCPLTCGIWCWLWVVSVRIELNCGTPVGVRELVRTADMTIPRNVNRHSASRSHRSDPLGPGTLIFKKHAVMLLHIKIWEPGPYSVKQICET